MYAKEAGKIGHSFCFTRQSPVHLAKNLERRISKMIKRRKLAIVTFVLLAVMLVSVGFAVIEGDLTLTLNASSAPQDFNVVFTEAEAIAIVDSQNDGSAVMVSVENTKLEEVGSTVTIGGASGAFVATMKVENLTVVGDYVTVDFTVKNFNAVDMQVTVKDPTMSVFAAEYGFHTVGVDTLAKTTVIGAGQSASFHVTVRLASSVHDTEASEKIVFEFDGTSTIPTT